ncbi:MAG: MBL fold metallo-hydrolase [Dehalococcoidia bacterium]|nr:MBL fold metallo-hydrolase [Dehalococcoidia bacterium]
MHESLTITHCQALENVPMLLQKLEVIQEGKSNGEGTVMRCRTRKGTDIFCLGVPLFYESGEDWDLGPTFCYLVRGDRTVLIDAGQFDRYDLLRSLIKRTGCDVRDIEHVVVTHSHEDHDGNLPELLAESGAQLWAHHAFQSMISYHQGVDDNAAHPDFPGSCRCCVMPDKFNGRCRNYQIKRSSLKIGQLVKDNATAPSTDYRFLLTPGHSPDALCTVFEEEVLFSGDTLLATITPHPTLMLEYFVNRRILPDGYGADNSAYGLMAYINSLHKIKTQCGDIDLLLPAHRLFENGRINYLKPSERAAEIIAFHLERCQNVLKILGNKTLSPDSISEQLFEPGLRRGWGRYLSQREVFSHLELLAVCGDIDWEDKVFTSRATGTHYYRDFFARYM